MCMKMPLKGGRKRGGGGEASTAKSQKNARWRVVLLRSTASPSREVSRNNLVLHWGGGSSSSSIPSSLSYLARKSLSSSVHSLMVMEIGTDAEIVSINVSML